MILTVTLNAALDLTYRVPHLVPHASHRVREVTERPGGKGLNVARVLGALGFRTTVTGFAGGETGRTLRTLLAADGAGAGRAADGDRGSGTAAGSAGTGGETAAVTDALVEVAGPTRRTVGVVDESTGDTTQLNEPGPHISPEEWERFLTAYRGLLEQDVEAVALCGSLPPGVPVGAYATLVREARTAGIPALLDTSGEPLRRGLAARPDLVKPNADELAGITGTAEPLRAARAAQRRGARAVAASLGADGMLLVTQDGAWSAAVPERLAGNPTGAGDSAVAGLLSGLAEGLPWPERLARAVALSAATVRAPVAGEFDEQTYARMLPSVRVRGAETP
ncbi:1-phosphofructokinase family hexose kinase [Streptomyces sp. WMMB303]|uniref:1-phosphofructokinase family hexose kinase n=1 Tax=Streptomyces sp. WMMB303 TaxID=3034154 RepID=UPI0023EA809B|nr:1-phosphofructokinase family hexose kinase [Streptomyces sp. WMMB303]MDF4251390.1 1-phosphofructokinase family hexose kinase [Streptomyces sp. WMMB303]